MTRREFRFVEGSSSKFWAVSVDDRSMTVQFGKIATAGQTQVKSFASHAEATAAAEKLVAEKTRKGYQEVAGEPTLAPAKAPPAPPAAPSPSSERRLDLAPEDWRRARGEYPTHLPPLAPERPFDLAAMKVRAQEAIDRSSQNGQLQWPAAVTGEEARFWLYLFSTVSGLMPDDRRAAIRKLTDAPFRKPVSLAEMKATFEKLFYWGESLPILRLQRSWMAPDDFVEAAACHPVVRLAGPNASEMADWLEAEVYPRLDEAAMRTVRTRLLDLMRGGDRDLALVAAVLGRHAGLDAELLAFVRGLKKGGIPPGKVNEGWAVALFGIKDPARLIEEFRRLGLRMVTPADARTWLALTGHDALDVLRDSILGQRKAADLLALLDVLALAKSPEAAVALTAVKLQAKPSEAADRINAWLKANRDHAVAGLAPLAAEKTPLGEAARAFLADAAPPGGAKPPSGDGPPAEAGWLRAALDATKPAKSLPPFADPAALPPLPGLAAADVGRVVSALLASTLVGPHPLVAALRRQGDKAALAAFSWALFEGWVAAGAPPKEKWALTSLGHFGGDAEVLRLTPLIRAWPGESQHQRAVTGLEVLRTIGSDVALTQLNGMALKLKFKALQERARSLMDAIAADRGLSREQLADRIVPDLGFDADGGRWFDFGPRRFRFTLDAELKPAVSDESGKPMKDLPKPGAKDDATKAAEATAAWKALKAQLRQTLPVQSLRLEDAMITGRAWTPDEFRTLLVRHPLMRHLVRRLVWQGAELFRVADDGSTVNDAGKPVSLTKADAVRVAHRLRLTPAQVESWRKALDAVGLEPPFPQLERSTFAPRPAEANDTDFVRPAGDVPALRMRGNLEARGWRRLMHDQGGITGFSRAYPAANVTAVVQIEPWILIGMQDNQDQHVTAAFFVTGVDHPSGPCSDEVLDHLPRLRLADVDAVAYSETENDLQSLSPSGKG